MLGKLALGPLGFVAVRRACTGAAAPCAVVLMVACAADENADDGGAVDAQAEASDGSGGALTASGGRTGTGGRRTGTGGRRASTGGSTGTGGRSTGGGGTGAGGATATGGAAGTGGFGGGGSGGLDASTPDAEDGSFDAPAPDATSTGEAGTEGGAREGGKDSAADADPGAADDAMPDAGADAGPGVLDLPFDGTGGAISYSGLNADNWSGDIAYVVPHSGTQALVSANGNATGTFSNLGVTKVLGGIVEDRPYTVSFYVVQYLGGFQGIELSDFSVLRIGGPTGTVTWTSTPVPTVTDEWVQWTGTYLPSPSDVGQPFRFEAVFDLDGMHTIGIDGPIRAVPQ